MTPLAPFEPFAPRHVRIDPYPFAVSPAIFTLERRVLAKRPRTGDEFRRELRQMPSETIEIERNRSPRSRRDRIASTVHMPRHLSLGEAAAALGVSVDTLRRWDRAGRIHTERDERNRRLAPASEIERLSTHASRHRTGTPRSARNRLTGIVRSVETDGVMALVEVEAGPFLVTAAITRDSIEELGLAPGVQATAVVKATSVMIERAEPFPGRAGSNSA